MTDYPRFEPLQGPPERLHERYHGGALVGFVVGLADRYLEGRQSWRDRCEVRPGGASLGVRRARRRALLTAVGMGAVVMTMTLALGGGRAGMHSGGGPALQPSKVTCPT